MRLILESLQQVIKWNEDKQTRPKKKKRGRSHMPGPNSLDKIEKNWNREAEYNPDKKPRSSRHS